MQEVTDYVNWIEVFWTAEGIIGIIICMISFAMAIEDRQAIKMTALDHGMDIIARTNVQMEIFRLIPHMFVLTIGVIALTITPSPYPTTDIAWAITIMLFCIPVCSAINTVNSIFTRRKLMKLQED